MEKFCSRCISSGRLLLPRSPEMLRPSPCTTGDSKCIPGAKRVTQISVPPVARTARCWELCTTKTVPDTAKPLLVSGGGSTSTRSSARLPHRYGSPAPGPSPWWLSGLLWVHLRSVAVCSGLPPGQVTGTTGTLPKSARSP